MKNNNALHCFVIVLRMGGRLDNMEDKFPLPHDQFSGRFREQRPRATAIKCLLKLLSFNI